VRRPALLAAIAAALGALAAAPAGATNECKGLQICVPITGPWVLTPAAAEVQYQLPCPKGFVVAGLDAELTTRGIQVSFRGALGSPVNPGITTTTAAVFFGRLLRGTDPAASFRPHIGCIPASGGGQRLPTSLHVYPPAKPTLPEMTEIPVRLGTHRYVKRCATGEQLVSASHAIAFYTVAPPTRALAASVGVVQSVRGGRLHVSVHGGPAAGEVRAVVQVDLLCVAGK
jgi:hypothetical protein